jgi:hypothetical protein
MRASRILAVLPPACRAPTHALMRALHPMPRRNKPLFHAGGASAAARASPGSAGAGAGAGPGGGGGQDEDGFRWTVLDIKNLPTGLNAAYRQVRLSLFWEGGRKEGRSL